MAHGWAKVRKNGRGETIFDVHHWSDTRSPFVCSSVCAHRERGLALDPRWRREDDAGEIRSRLAPKQNQSSGADKGRVLYLIERRPLRGGLRVAAAGLMSVEPGVFKLYRLCFSSDTLRAQQPLDATMIVACARALARDGAQSLRMLVPPNASPGEVAQQFGFAGGTVKDGFGQTWIR
jgi:hypothetical protein